MVQDKVVVGQGNGLHARPASVLCKTASKFESTVKLISDTKTIDAKSMIGILSLGANPGQELTLEADGADASEAIEAIKALFLANFDE